MLELFFNGVSHVRSTYAQTFAIPLFYQDDTGSFRPVTIELSLAVHAS